MYARGRGVKGGGSDGRFAQARLFTRSPTRAVGRLAAVVVSLRAPVLRVVRPCAQAAVMNRHFQDAVTEWAGPTAQVVHNSDVKRRCAEPWGWLGLVFSKQA